MLMEKVGTGNEKMETTKNLRALYLAKILYEQTDEDHPLSTNQLIEALQNEFGISAHRVTIYEDMEQLRSFGVDIYTIKSTQNKYYLAERLFDLPELKLLIDAVESSKFITAKKSQELVGKITQLSSRNKADELKRTLYAEGRIKPENEKIYYIVDAIHAAINAGKKISFAYFQYNGRKQQKLKNSGAEYVCSPWMLVWNGDCYYLLGHTDKHGVTPFRVDRIALPPHILEEAAVPQPEDFDITRVNTMFGMFIGEPQRVTLVCDNSVMDHIVDRFGEDVETFPVDGKTFQASVLVTASKPFFGWVFGFDGKVRITAPAKLKSEYDKMLQRAVESN